ncbi:MAG: TrmH family RNA methyltransferase [Rubricoccaceae bacterium]
MTHPIVVVVPDVRSAYNVGAMLRTADAAGLAHVYCCGFTPSPVHRGVAKTALGAQDAVPWSHHDDVYTLLDTLRARGHTLAALERAEGARLPDQLEATHFPLALVVGNELTGVPPDVLAACDVVVGLPQFGVKASLNVSVAFGVAAYGIVARYRALHGLGPAAERIGITG